MNDKVVYGWFFDDECFYIGMGTKRRSRETKSRNPYCLNVMNQAKEEGGFEIRILKSGLNTQQAHSLERLLIQQYGRRDLGTGTLTNLTNGGEGCDNLSKEARKKISDSKKGKPVNFKNGSSPLEGVPLKEEHKERISNSRKGKGKGRKRTEETKKKISESQKGEKGYWFGKRSPRAKRVVTPYGTFDSIQAAADVEKVTRKTIRDRMKKRSRTYYLEQ